MAQPHRGRPRPLQWLGRIAVVWAVESAALALLAWLLPGVTVGSPAGAAFAVAAIGLLNALLWPLLSLYTLPLAVATLGLFSLGLNALIIRLAAELLPGFSIRGFWTPLLVALGLSALSTLFSGLLTLDDDGPYYRNVVARRARRRGATASDVPGVLFLEIDGLAAPVLRRAVRGGYMPTVARWIDAGSHHLAEWECDLSSQTAASQAGILLGDNEGIPAFRWYERDGKRLMVSSRPRVAAEIERRLSRGDGLLAGRGASRNNMFSGDAANVILTMSAATDRSRLRSGDYYAYFANPYNVSRMLVLSLWDVLSELRGAWLQKRRGVRPRLDHRGRAYPFIRAATTVALSELSVWTLIGDMYEGAPVAYATFLGYDEVAHHSGVERPEALEVLSGIDRQLARLEAAARRAPRPYELVVLSDHGQSQGATFRQRYGRTLEELARALLAAGASVRNPARAGEDWGRINAALTEGIREEGRAGARALRRSVRGRTYDGDVLLGPDHEGEEAGAADADVIVLASGNLGLIYFTGAARRLTLEQIGAAHPGLVAGLAEHPGIGFVHGRSAAAGPLAIGADGVHALADGRVEGGDPLAPFGPRAAAHLLRHDGFAHAPDLLVNSTYDPDWDEVAAFEELVGSHGGLGGDQARPFVLAPADWDMGTERIIGAGALHVVLKAWLRALHGDRRGDGAQASQG